MSKMSDLAIDIENALEEGFSLETVVFGIMSDYGLGRAEALKFVNQVIDWEREIQ